MFDVGIEELLLLVALVALAVWLLARRKYNWRPLMPR